MKFKIFTWINAALVTTIAFNNASAADVPGADVKESSSDSAMPIGYVETMGPATDLFNDLKTQGFVSNGIRFVPDVSAVAFHETNPFQNKFNVSDSGRIYYMTLTATDMAQGGFTLFAGFAGTKYNNISDSISLRHLIRYSGRGNYSDWVFPYVVSMSSDAISRSSFYTKKSTGSTASFVAEQVVKQNWGHIRAQREFDKTSLELALKVVDFKLGANSTSEGVSTPSNNNSINYTVKASLKRKIDGNATIFVNGQLFYYDYDTAWHTDEINPTSKVSNISVGASKEFANKCDLTAEIGSSNKDSGRPDLVPQAQHPIGLLRANWSPYSGIQTQAGFSRSTEELNETTLSNLVVDTVSLGVLARLSDSFGINMSADRSSIRTNELLGNVVDTKL